MIGIRHGRARPAALGPSVRHAHPRLELGVLTVTALATLTPIWLAIGFPTLSIDLPRLGGQAGDAPLVVNAAVNTDERVQPHPHALPVLEVPLRTPARRAVRSVERVLRQAAPAHPPIQVRAAPIESTPTPVVTVQRGHQLPQKVAAPVDAAARGPAREVAPRPAIAPQTTAARDPDPGPPPQSAGTTTVSSQTPPPPPVLSSAPSVPDVPAVSVPDLPPLPAVPPVQDSLPESSTIPVPAAPQPDLPPVQTSAPPALP